MTVLTLILCTPFVILAVFGMRYAAEGSTPESFKAFCWRHAFDLLTRSAAVWRSTNLAPRIVIGLISLAIIALFQWYALWALPLFWLVILSYSL